MRLVACLATNRTLCGSSSIVGKSGLADSYVDGRTVFVVLNPLAAFNSELLAFTIAHELVGHWFLQYLETFDIEGSPGSTLSTENDDFRQGIAQDVNLRAYAEVFAHIISGRLLQKWTAASQAELFRGLENAPQIEFLDSALGYLHTTFGEQRDTKEIVGVDCQICTRQLLPRRTASAKKAAIDATPVEHAGKFSGNGQTPVEAGEGVTEASSLTASLNTRRLAHATKRSSVQKKRKIKTPRLPIY